MSGSLALSDAAQSPLAARTLVLVGPLPPPSGGMANQTRQLARLLEAEGCTVRLVQTNADYRPAWVRNIKGLRALFRLLPFFTRLWRECEHADVMHVMANSGWAWHLFAAPAIWIGAWRDVPVIVNYRGGEAREFFARQFAWIHPTLRRVQAVVVPSGFLREVFAQHGVAAAIVPNIVDLDAFHAASTLPTAPHVLVTRNLEPIYDIGTAIRAFAIVAKRHPEARITIAGSGPERASLEALAAATGLAGAVNFTGRIDNANLPALYRTATVALNPSTVDNMPNSLLEALASGVPVVSTNVGGVPHLVRDGETALLVPPSDPQAMADAVLRVIDDPGLASRLRAAGLQAVSSYAWPKVKPLWIEAYRQASLSRSTAPRSTAPR